MIKIRPDNLFIVASYHRTKNNSVNSPIKGQFRYSDHIANYSEFLISSAFGKLCAPSLALDWQIKRLIEVEARVSYHARRWYVHIASAFPLAHHYRAVRAWVPLAPSQ
jgi:hypothetical protein